MKHTVKSDESNYTNPNGPDDEMLGVLQRETFAYFL
jgi:DNA-binding transcriptional regulator YiaG